MPVPFATAFRGLIVLALSLHVFYMYNLARALQGGYGIDFGASVLAALFAIVMLLPLVWAVSLTELPEIYTQHVRARRWFKKGRCPQCGYPTVAIAAGEACSECGKVLAEPQPYVVSRRTIYTFVLANVLAWGIGSVAGEVWAQADERQFAREATQHVNGDLNDSYTRPRWWPADSRNLMYDTVNGVHTQ